MMTIEKVYGLRGHNLLVQVGGRELALGSLSHVVSALDAVGLLTAAVWVGLKAIDGGKLRSSVIPAGGAV